MTVSHADSIFTATNEQWKNGLNSAYEFWQTVCSGDFRQHRKLMVETWLTSHYAYLRNNPSTQLRDFSLGAIEGALEILDAITFGCVVE